MNFTLSKTRRRYFALVLLLAALLDCAGCAYFRTSDLTYQELDQKNKETQKRNHQMLSDGLYGSWSP